MFIIPTLEGGGAERVAANLLAEFSKTDNKIVLVLFSKKTGYGLPDNVKVRLINTRQHHNIVYIIFNFFFVIFNLSKIIKEEKPYSVLSFMDYTNIVSIAANYLSCRKAKVNISVHTSPALHLKKYSGSRWNAIISMLIKLLYNRTDKIIAVSNFIKSDLIKSFSIKESRVMVIYNPVDIEKINMLASAEVAEQWFKEDVPVVISVGRLLKEKDHETLLKAFAIAKKQADMRLLIVGEGKEKHKLKEISKKIGMDNDVAFLGYKKNPFKYMKRATVFVLSSLYEGFPNVIVEAMACGVPVISTQYNPCQHEIIEHEKTGIVIPIADEKALAEAILRLLRDKKLCVSLTEEAMKKVAYFSIERIANRYRSVLDI